MRPILVWLPPVLIGVAAFAAARLAMMPGLGYWDTAELQTVAPLLGTAHPTGFPTYVLLGWLVNAVLTPIALFVIAVEPAIIRRPGLIVGCTALAILVVTLVYLELPLRAGPLWTPGTLVYGRPDTWDGFWYIALAEQFRGSVVGPFDDLPGKLGALVGRAVDAYGPLAALLPLAFGATAFRRPSYALLTGTAVAITCFFAASYENAMIERYYVGPVLIGWTWLAILAERLVVLAGLTAE